MEINQNGANIEIKIKIIPDLLVQNIDCIFGFVTNKIKYA